MLRIVLGVTVGLLAMPAAVLAQARPTLSFDQPCYSPGDTMMFSGSGYTPNGEVNLFFTANNRFGTYGTRSDAAGNISGGISTPDPDGFVDDDEYRATVNVTANDRTRIESGAPPDQQFAAAQFTLSRWEVAVAKRGRGLRLTAVGFTHAKGESLYVHYRRGGRTVKSVRLGRLRGDCGDLTKSLPRALPRDAKPGRYRLVFNNAARNASRKPSITESVQLR